MILNEEHKEISLSELSDYDVDIKKGIKERDKELKEIELADDIDVDNDGIENSSSNDEPIEAVSPEEDEFDTDDLFDDFDND